MSAEVSLISSHLFKLPMIPFKDPAELAVTTQFEPILDLGLSFAPRSLWAVPSTTVVDDAQLDVLTSMLAAMAQ